MRKVPVGLVVLLALACKKREQPAPVASVSVEPAAQLAPVPEPDVLDLNPPHAPCVFSAAGHDVVPFFASREALREWLAALERHDKEGAEAVRAGEHAVLVANGTRCTRLDIDIDVVYVRVTSGDRKGQLGWTKREWTFAKGKDDEYGQ